MILQWNSQESAAEAGLNRTRVVLLPALFYLVAIRTKSFSHDDVR
jgi:hypothetical protein